MPKTPSLIKQLKVRYPGFSFKPDVNYMWSPQTKTVHYIDQDPDQEYILHELAHGLLGHKSYGRDIELLKMEREAWSKAAEIAKDIPIPISEDLIEDNLDSYRDWMHSRSRCPKCSSTGLQTAQNEYSCPACNSSWLVNEARTCGLKRYLK